jgi:hypothetical protein
MQIQLEYQERHLMQTAHSSSTNLAKPAIYPMQILLWLDQVCDQQNEPSLLVQMCMALLLLVPAQLHHKHCWGCLMPASKRQQLPSNLSILVATLPPNSQSTLSLCTAQHLQWMLQLLWQRLFLLSSLSLLSLLLLPPE